MRTIEELAKSLALTPEQRELAQDAYNEIAGLLDRELAGYAPLIYVQGSTRLGTATQPVNVKDDFDIDFVCLLTLNTSGITPEQLKSIVGGVLQNHFGTRAKPKRRCWQLKFSGFHVDVIPALPEDNTQEVYEDIEDNTWIARPIRIADKDLKRFLSSNPEGYALWFDRQGELGGGKGRVLLRDSIVPHEVQESNFNTLQTVVMLAKRHRDHMYANGNSGDAPISIIITTLFAGAYNGAKDIVSAMRQIVNALPDRVSSDSIKNPANPKENFADKWKEHPERKVVFNQWLAAFANFVDGIEDIERDPAKGTRELRVLFEDHYGAELAERAILEHASNLNSQQIGGSLKAAAGGALGTAVGTRVSAHTNHGD